MAAFLRVEDSAEPGIPQGLPGPTVPAAPNRVIAQIQTAGGRTPAVEADLADQPRPRCSTPQKTSLAVDILVGNATGWLAGTFSMTVAWTSPGTSGFTRQRVMPQ